MLETCENCFGKGKTHELPPKRCMDCKGKGVVESISIQDTGGNIILVEDPSKFQESQIYGQSVADFDPPKPWYKRIFK